jgi:hypothetical protein
VDWVVYSFCALQPSLWASHLIYQCLTKALLSDSGFLQHEQDELNSSINCIQRMFFSLTLEIPSTLCVYNSTNSCCAEMAALAMISTHFKTEHVYATMVVSSIEHNLNATDAAELFVSV